MREEGIGRKISEESTANKMLAKIVLLAKLASMVCLIHVSIGFAQRTKDITTATVTIRNKITVRKGKCALFIVKLFGFIVVLNVAIEEWFNYTDRIQT